MKRFTFVLLSIAFLAAFVGCAGDVTKPVLNENSTTIIHAPQDSTGAPGDSTHTTWGKIKYGFWNIYCPDPPDW